MAADSRQSSATAENGRSAAEWSWSRRSVLRAAGSLIALPFLPSLFPRQAWAGESGPPEPAKPPLRLLFCCTPMGFVPNHFILDRQPEYKPFDAEGWIPEQVGGNFTLPKVHAALAPFRDRISFIRGLTNARYRGDVHNGDDVFLTCADTYADPARSFSNDISCDQVAAGYAPMGGPQVRLSSLSLGIGPVMGCLTGGLSWGRNGVPISPVTSPAAAFDRLFGRDDVPAHVRIERLRAKRSVLDAAVTQVKHLNQQLDAADARKLDEVVSAVRDVEAMIQREERWIAVPKPTVALGRPGGDADATRGTAHPQAMLALIHAAFLTDSTRVITYELPDIYLDLGFHTDKHGLNHGGGECHAWALRNDTEHSNQLAACLAKLDGSREADGTSLLHNTIGSFGSGIYGMNHYNRELPLMLFGEGGGRIRQGAVRVLPPKTPMANLWLTMLKATGMALERFADSTGSLAELAA